MLHVTHSLLLVSLLMPTAYREGSDPLGFQEALVQDQGQPLFFGDRGSLFRRAQPAPGRAIW